jgi:hypothetical protein
MPSQDTLDNITPTLADNLNLSCALGIKIPQSVPLRADRTIE